MIRRLCAGLVLGLWLSAGTAFAGEKVRLPQFQSQLEADETVVAIDGHIVCLGVSDLRGIPDGWNMKFESAAGSYKLHLERPDSSKANDRALRDLEFRIEFREGQFDCAGMTLLLHTRAGSDSFVREFQYPMYPRRWIGGDRKPE